eukprot:SAG11_NODE_23355_length_390_cov_0.721649_1_plen_57_part_01
MVSQDVLEALKACISTGADEEEELSEKVVVSALNGLRHHCQLDCVTLINGCDDGTLD